VQRFVAEGVFVPRPAINRLELCPPDATFCWKRARISSQLQVHIPSARHAADGCSCPLQHHRLGHHDRAFQTILCASCHRRPRALHISARHEQTRAAYAANEAPTHPQHPPASPARLHLTLAASASASLPQVPPPSAHPHPVLCCFRSPLFIVTRSPIFSRLPFARPPSPLPRTSSSAPHLPRSRLLCFRSPGTPPRRTGLFSRYYGQAAASHVVGCAIADSWPSSLLTSDRRSPKHAQPPSPCLSVRSEVRYAALKIVMQGLTRLQMPTWSSG
jgi:hypothetical protein